MTLHIGDIVNGKVSGVRPYGVFIKIDGTDKQGLIHISECKHGYVDDISQVLQPDQRVHVRILDIDEYSGKISLSLRVLENINLDKTSIIRKNFWTNYKLKIGYQSIADKKADWINDITSRMK